jgi:bifunctional enzyme CysN/CysC
VHLIGIRNIVLAVNKMDLIDYDQAKYDAIVADYAPSPPSIGIKSFTAMPISGFKGDNITANSANTPWYRLAADRASGNGRARQHRRSGQALPPAGAMGQPPQPRFPGFFRPDRHRQVKPGDAIRVLPSGKTSTVTKIVTLDGDLDEAVAGQSVTLCFADEVDCSRGNVIATADAPPEVSDQFEATSSGWMTTRCMWAAPIG